ncbi:MAG: glycosyltransferase family 2 protein [Candidatus Nanopelagicales bacterium]
MSLAVLMPAYNERPTIETIVRAVLAEDVVSEVIIVDDGSTDGTREYLEEAKVLDPRIQVYFHPENQGKGAAIRTALHHATAPVSIIQDADLEYSPADFAAVIRPIVEGDARVVYGSRVLLRSNEYPIDSFRVGSFVVTMVANLLYGCRLTDEPTCYKAFSTDFLQSLPLRSMGFELCPELTAWSRRRGERIMEVPIHYDKRSVAQGKKIRWTDGVVALGTLLRLRFARDPGPPR